MSRKEATALHSKPSFPRTRGDEPKLVTVDHNAKESSLHTWG